MSHWSRTGLCRAAVEGKEIGAVGRKWLKEDLRGPRRGRSKALGRAGSKDTKQVKGHETGQSENKQ